MITMWLRSEERAPQLFSSFGVFDIAESQSRSDAILTYLQAILGQMRFNPSFVEAATQRLGPAAFARLRAELQPRREKMRRGVFGELLASAALEAFHGYANVAPKWRYAITRGQSLPGTDAILLKTDSSDNIIDVCFVETKLRTTADPGAASEAAEQLTADYSKVWPDMLIFTAQRLDESHHPLAAAFMNYLQSRQDNTSIDTFRVYLVWDDKNWTERTLQNLSDSNPEISPLVVHLMRLTDLRSLCDALFQKLGEEVDDDDD